MMKAVVVYEAGGPEVLKLETRPIPTAKQGWVLIKVKAFGLNRSEMFTRKGDSPDVKFPRILGIEASGIVEDAPGGEFKPGDTVSTAMGSMGRSFDGGYAEYTLVPAGQVQKLNTKLPWEVIGACGEMFQTVYGSLFKSLRLEKGEKLLIRGGSSSIGLAAAAIAKKHGVEVYATTRSTAREQLLKRNGVDKVIIDNENIAEQVKNLSNGGVNKVLELVGTTTLGDSLASAAPNGIVCMTGIVGGSWSIENFAPFATIPSSVCLTTFASTVKQFMETPLQELLEQIEAGTLSVPIGKTFSLDQIVQAHALMDSNEAGGKIVVLP